MPAAHIRHRGPGLELGDDALEGGQPLGHQMRPIAGPEEALGAPKHRRMVLAPREGAIAAHGGDQLVLVEEEARQHHGAARDEDRRILDRQRQGLLGGQTKLPLDVLHIARRRLGAEPLPDEPCVAPRLGREFLGRDGDAVGHRAVQPQFFAQDDIRDHGRSTHVGDQLAHKLMQFGFVHGLSSSEEVYEDGSQGVHRHVAPVLPLAGSCSFSSPRDVLYQEMGRETSLQVAW